MQKYIALTGHIWDGHYIFTNGKKWTAMPEEVRAAITKDLTEAALKEREDIQRLNDELVATMTKAGVDLQHAGQEAFPRRVEDRRLLRGLEGQVRRRALGAAREIHRPALSQAPAAPRPPSGGSRAVLSS